MLTLNPKTGLVSVDAGAFLSFLHRRKHPCPLFHWDGQEPLEVHHLGQPGAKGAWMRRKNDGLCILIPRSVHAQASHWENEGDGNLYAAAVAYAMADLLWWLIDPEDDEPRLGDPLALIVQGALVLAERDHRSMTALRQEMAALYPD